jgi:hypothetical protein
MGAPNIFRRLKRRKSTGKFDNVRVVQHDGDTFEDLKELWSSSILFMKKDCAKFAQSSLFSTYSSEES